MVEMNGVIGASKHVFWQALVFTIIVFGIGLVFGYFLESFRANSIELNLLGSEVNLLDEEMRSKIIGEGNLSCDIAVGSTFAFADKIYEEMLKLEKYGASSKFNQKTLIVLHKRYDLLRMILWDESIKLRKRCHGFHSVVYFFDYTTEDVDLKGEQAFFSRLLMDLKNKYPNEILIIPIAADLDLASVEIAMENYNARKSPVILIDEKDIIDKVMTFEEIERLIF